MNMPFSLAFFVLILTTHVLKGGTSVGGVPTFLVAFAVGLPLSALLHFVVLPPLSAPARGGGGKLAGGASDGAGLEASAGQSLLGGAVPVDAHTPGAAAAAADASAAAAAADHHHAAHHRKPWYKRLGAWLGGSNREPPPRGWPFAVLLLLSFVMALFWLLVIANEIVGTALCFGKVLGVPDVVMGLTVRSPRAARGAARAAAAPPAVVGPALDARRGRTRLGLAQCRSHTLQPAIPPRTPPVAPLVQVLAIG